MLQWIDVVEGDVEVLREELREVLLVWSHGAVHELRYQLEIEVVLYAHTMP